MNAFVRRVATLAAVLSGTMALAGCQPTAQEAPDTTVEHAGFSFTAVQPELFGAAGGQPNAWVDFDGDGDLDLNVGFRDRPNRLYRNDAGTFIDVASEVGLDVAEDTRALAWGDYDGDGDLDVYVGFPVAVEQPDRLYRNDDGMFVNVAADVGLLIEGTTRQTSWVDIDGDQDLDLFVALRDRPNRLFRNDDGAFTDITDDAGVGDPRKTVGVVWFDYDVDGDLDLFVSNQNGDQDALFRNDGGTFTDVAAALGMDWPDRPDDIGGVGPAVTDYDNDGDLDLFTANYGPDVLWRNNGDGTFTDATGGEPLGADIHSTTAAWGDADNDGQEDLFVAAFLGSVPEAPDHVFRNEGGAFVDATPDALIRKGASHGVRWADYDGDGDLDLALANNNAEGGHWLYRNELSAEQRSRSLQVWVRSGTGQGTVPGAEVHIRDASTGAHLGTRLVDTGGGYCSQGVAPVFFAFGPEVVSVTVTVVVPNGTTRVETVGGTFAVADVGGGAISVNVAP